MSNVFKKLACLKSNMRLCGSKSSSSSNSSDYEVVSYDKASTSPSPQPQPAQQQHKKQTASTNLVRKPIYNSTQLELDDSSSSSSSADEQAAATMNISRFPILMLDASPEHIRSSHQQHNSNERAKLTSTHIQPIEWSLTNHSNLDNDNTYVEPPTLSQIDESRFNCFSTIDDNTTAATIYEELTHALQHQHQQHQQVNPSFFHSASDDTEELYVCCVSYVAKCNEEMTLDYADRVKLIYDRGDAMLVQNVVTGRCGYAPSVCLVPVQTFLEDLRYLMDEF